MTELAERDGVAKRVPAGSLLMSFKLSIGRLAVPAQDVFPNEAIAWIRPNDGVLQEFLRHALAAVKWDELGSRAVMGKTLNAASLDAVPLAVPPLAQQTAIVETLDAIERATRASKLQVDRLRDVRSNLLTALLSDEHAIPESYDELMEELAA